MSQTYCQPADVTNRFDNRVIAQLLSDTGVPIAGAMIPTNTILLALIADATSSINEVCLIGGRYQVQDLVNLVNTSTDTGNVLAADANALIRLCAELTYIYLNDRRHSNPPDPLVRERVNRQLEKLRLGEDIFNIVSNVQSGTNQSMFPSFQTYETVYLLRDATRGRFYPNRRYQQLGSQPTVPPA